MFPSTRSLIGTNLFDQLKVLHSVLQRSRITALCRLTGILSDLHWRRLQD